MVLKHVKFAPYFLSILDLTLMQTRAYPLNLYLLYAADCMVKTVPEVYAALVENRLYRFFTHVYRNADAETVFQLVGLLRTWEEIKPELFSVTTIETLREGLGNGRMEAPDSPDVQTEHDYERSRKGGKMKGNTCKAELRSRLLLSMRKESPFMWMNCTVIRSSARRADFGSE